MKEYLRASELEIHHEVVLCYIQDIAWWMRVLPPCRDAVSVFYSLGCNKDDCFCSVWFYSISTIVGYYRNLRKGYWMRNNQKGGCKWYGNLYTILTDSVKKVATASGDYLAKISPHNCVQRRYEEWDILINVRWQGT